MDIPYEIVGLIFTKLCKDAKYLLEDKILERFIIKYSCIHPETMLIWFVKNRNKQALVLYTTQKKHNIMYVSTDVIKCLVKIAIANYDIDILQHLIDLYISRFQDTSLYGALVQIVINKCIKSKCLAQKKHLIMFLQTFCLKCSNIKYFVNKDLLKTLLKNNEFDQLLKLLIKQRYIKYVIAQEVEIRTLVISYNHLCVLKYIIDNGHRIELYDVVVGISVSNIKMIKYITSYFKPRLYSKGFSNLLLTLTEMRKNPKIYNCVYNTLH